MANIIHGNSDKAQGEFFRDQADKFKRSGCSIQSGKGSKRRPGNVKTFRANYDSIFRKGK